MKAFVAAAIITIASSALADEAQVVAQAQPTPHARYSGTLAGYYRATTLDLNLEGGGGYFWGNQSSAIGFGRLRTGVMFAGWPVTTCFGVTFEINNLSAATIGLQAELIHVASGLWAQIGATIDGRANAGAALAVGYALFGIEAQVRGYDEVRPQTFDGNYGFALLGKLRIPLGYIFYALSRK